MRRCTSCARPHASDAEWTAYLQDPAISDCLDPACAWGGDRCWSQGNCGCPPDAVVDLRQRAGALRGRRAWSATAHHADHPVQHRPVR